MVGGPETGHGVQGRLIDHLRNTASVALEDLNFLVLDEADRLLDMGFADEVLPCLSPLSARLSRVPRSGRLRQPICQMCRA